jgi:predicted ATPase
MLKSIELKNFKVHKHTELELRPITILTGINGMGKSSVLQSLLLLRQSVGVGYISGLNLKGDLNNAGFANEVLCQDAKGNALEISVETEKGKTIMPFLMSNELDTFLLLQGAPIAIDAINSSLFTDDFQYISAFRYGPQSTYLRDSFIVKQHRQISQKMGMCEYAVHFLFEYGKTYSVLPELMYSGTEVAQLEDQVQAWMEAIAPAIMIKIEQQGNDLKLNYRYRREGQTSTRDISAMNTGFGITYMLPLLVALLSARPGALIMIENPEAHIHPRAQAVFMELVAKCAKVGIQVILETHSDHIINGAMVAVHDGYPVEDVAVYYIEREYDEHAALVERLDLQQNGRILRAPKGFCDQIDIDLAHILRRQ